MITKTTRLVPIEAYQDEDGKPVCGDCHYCRGEHVIILFLARKTTVTPGPLCPVWGPGSKEVKDNE